MLKGVIFDINGTLLWDTVYHAQAFEELIRRYSDGKDGLKATPMTAAEMDAKIMGKPNDLIMPIIFGRKFTKADIARLGEEKEQIYRELYRERIAFAPGVYDLWQWLKERGIPFTVASSADRGNIEFYYQHTDIGSWIDREIVTYNDGSIKHGKPAPDIFLLAAHRLGVAPQDCVVFEDSPSGIQAAEASGAKVIVVASAEGYPRTPHPTIFDFREAMEIFEKGI